MNNQLRSFFLQATLAQSSIDRNTVDQIKSHNNPPSLVGEIMELIISLLQQHGGHPGATSDQPSTTPTMQKHAKKTGKLDKEHWANLQAAIGDSQRFMEMIRGLRWEDGLSMGAVHLIKSRLSMAHLETEGDVTNGAKNGSGTLESGSDQLITISAARHASKGVASMCTFAVNIVNYHYKLEAFKKVQVRLEHLRKDHASKLKWQVTSLESEPLSLYVCSASEGIDNAQFYRSF